MGKIDEIGLDPPRHMRVLLEEHRNRGFTFEVAWEKSFRSLPRGTDDHGKTFWHDWRKALRWARPHYEAAYHRWEADYTVLYTVIDMDDPMESVL
jgi:hypothetical protein